MPASPHKKSLRAECMTARERIQPDYAKTAAVAVARHLLQMIPVTAKIVAGYQAVRGEVDLGEAMAQLSERGHALCLPVVQAPGQPLIFRHWSIGHPLVVGHYGISVPPDSEPEVVPDAVIVPLAGFDMSGHRLGYGAGFYDGAIRKLRQANKQVVVIGAAFAVQQIDAIPFEMHDEKLDAVATEKEALRFA